ncbi:helix-turn-helix domain-containing protein [Bradyrhizobium sp.]|uniref:helix-turn-helix domain-containing protein n=1 Tax=Bradyrhizobium sp. TaxID=376 RepID=UPI002DDD2560|nr:helix-turn-helix domain-containing protein [Bradyrhizobium sp.]HEV2153009.1 helix-turn-helix domain-containing protein [Bradyrhizobium sp.]
MKLIPTADPDALLTEDIAAEILSISIRTLQSWRPRQAGPPFVQVGRAVRYRRRDLIAWIDANTCCRLSECRP